MTAAVRIPISRFDTRNIHQFIFISFLAAQWFALSHSLRTERDWVDQQVTQFDAHWGTPGLRFPVRVDLFLFPTIFKIALPHPHPVSYPIYAGEFFPAVKRPDREAYHPFHLGTSWKSFSKLPVSLKRIQILGDFHRLLTIRPPPPLIQEVINRALF
jgi:hypothetical protein